jgi:hypothetical protein
MAQVFHHSANTFARIAIFGAVFILGFLTWVVLLGGLLWPVILLMLTLSDFTTRGWIGVPGR